MSSKETESKLSLTTDEFYKLKLLFSEVRSQSDNQNSSNLKKSTSNLKNVQTSMLSSDIDFLQKEIMIQNQVLKSKDVEICRYDAVIVRLNEFHCQLIDQNTKMRKTVENERF